MTFLYPAFFWALGVLAVPVIIHLFNFRKTTRIYFSNTRFLRQVKEATTAKRKLRHYLILASRLLFLLFLVITFCQPFIPAREQLQAGQQVVLYLDNSPSMSAQTPDKTRALDAAVLFARNLVDLFPPDTRYKMITNDFAPSSNTFKTKSEVQELLSQVRLSPVSRSVQEVLTRMDQGGGAQQQEIFWVSDLQQSTAGAVKAIDSARRLHLVPIQLGTMPNIFVDTAYLDNPFAAGGEKNVLRVRVRNDGNKAVDQLNLKLTLNGIQVATTTVPVPAQGLQETNFDLTTGLKGFNEAQISFNDFPVSFDNDFYLALNFTDKIRVLEIKSGNSATPIEKVYANPQIFSFRSFGVNNFNYSLLDEADLVVVNGLNRLDASLAAALQQYQRRGRTLLLIPGAKPDVASYAPLTALPLARVQGTTSEELARPDFANPFFENVFEEKSVSLAMPKTVPVMSWGSDRDAILRFKNEQPFLSRFRQEGTIYLMASALEPGQSDFFNHALFVPVMYRLAAGARQRESRLYHSLHESFITVKGDSLGAEEQLKLTGRQTELIPAQRRLNREVLLDIPKFSMSEGFYRVLSSRDTLGLVAFNLDQEESLLRQYTGEEMQTLMGGANRVSIFEAGSSGAFSNEIKERYLGTPLWKYALMLALLFLLAEVLLIRFLR